MRYQGKITEWRDDRGFGFITPSGGGRPVFAHISAFKNGQKRPIGNEFVTYELINDPKKGFRAQNVVFFGATFRPSIRKEERSSRMLILAALLVAGIGIYVFQHFSSSGAKAPPDFESIPGAEEKAKFQCQGKRRCSQMTSCEEAIFYLKNCPGVEIDGDGDGIPCESQWCGN
jgi:cold shock CspA family protein